MFVVGTLQEEANIKALGFEAVTTQGVTYDRLATDFSAGGRTAIILLDDDAGAEFQRVCTAAGAPSRMVDDENITIGTMSALQDGGNAVPKDTMELVAVLTREEARAVEDAEIDREEARRRQLRRLGVHDVFDVALELSAGQADRKRIPTGLQPLDDVLEGGLTEGGLTTIGATSSAGKTTLALQVADHMAEAGRQVLFVTVEQSRYELVAKSISRIMRRVERSNGGWYSVGFSDILNADARGRWDEQTHNVFTAACAAYSKAVAPRLRIMELNHQPTVKEIRKAAQTMAEAGEGKQAPVVFVDYLQLLAPANDRMTERQAVDSNVMALRHLARDLQTCVVVISSLNRASYSEGVTMDALKESGAIEYGSDIVLGLQPRNFEQDMHDVQESKRKREARRIERQFKGRGIREAELKVLKNRGGATPEESVPVTFNARCNVFTAAEPEKADGARAVW